jgi:hypothetical protein
MINNSERIELRVPPAVKAAWVQLAELEGRKPSEYLRELIRRAAEAAGVQVTKQGVQHEPAR